MKKALLIFGILFIVLGVFSLALGGLYGYVRAHTLDASFGFYESRRKMMRLWLLVGAVLVVVGIVCLIIRSNR